MMEIRQAARVLGISRAALWQRVRTRRKRGVICYKREGRHEVYVDMEKMAHTPPKRAQLLRELYYKHYGPGFYSKVARAAGVRASSAYMYFSRMSFENPASVEKYITAIENSTWKS